MVPATARSHPVGALLRALRIALAPIRGGLVHDGRVVVERSWSDRLADTGPTKGGRARELPLTWDAVAALRGLPTTRHRNGYVFSAERPSTRTACAVA